MTIQPSIIRAVVFDYGNTLIEFSKKQIEQCDDALAATLTELFGDVDRSILGEARHRDRMAPYSGNPPEYRENNMAEISEELIVELYGRKPTRPELNAVLKTRFEAFVESVSLQEHVVDVLESLGRKYELAVLSNYPDPYAIRQSMAKLGLDRHFSTIVVSGEIGFVKPHPLPFKIVHEELFIPPGQVVHVGDNWLADIQGAKRAGMQAIHMQQWETPETMMRGTGDQPPDEIIERLDELLDIL